MWFISLLVNPTPIPCLKKSAAKEPPAFGMAYTRKKSAVSRRFFIKREQIWVVCRGATGVQLKYIKCLTKYKPYGFLRTKLRMP